MDIWLIRRGDYVCGLAVEVYGGLAGKVPHGRIAGWREGDRFLVQYTDSFSESGPYSARLGISAGRLHVDVLTGPAPDGYLSFKTDDLARVTPPMRDPLKNPPGKFDAYGSYHACIHNGTDPAAYLRE